jgi:hypothetical protein
VQFRERAEMVVRIAIGERERERERERESQLKKQAVRKLLIHLDVFHHILPLVAEMVALGSLLLNLLAKVMV